MEAVGWVAAGIVGLSSSRGVLVGVRSVPDVQRYLKIRRM